MVGSASTKRRRAQSEDSPSSAADGKKHRKSQQPVSSASKNKKRERPRSNSGEESTVPSPSRRKQPSRSASRGTSPAVSPRKTRRSASRGPSPAVSPLPSKQSSSSSPRRPLPSVSLHTVDEEASGAPVSVDQPSSSVPQVDSPQSPKQSLVPPAQSSPLLAESSSIRNTTYPERLTTTPSGSAAAVDVDPSCSARIAKISKRPVESLFKKISQPSKVYSHKKDVWWAKKVALIFVLSLAFLSLVVISWKLHLKDHELSQVDDSVSYFYASSPIKLLLERLKLGNDEMDVLNRQQQKVSDDVHSLRGQLRGYIEQLSVLEGEIKKRVSSSREELEAGSTVAQEFLKETITMEEEVRADLQMVMDEVVLNSGAAYLEELEVMNETLLQPASDAVNGWLNKIRHLEGVTSTSKERLLRLGETLEGLYKALEEKGTLQSLNSWLTRARDVQKIALKLQVERSRSLVAQVVAEMTSWALNATVQENRNGSCTNKHPPSKKDVEERIAEIIDSSLAGEVDEDGVDMAAHGIGGSILYHALYTSTDYVAPTHLLPFTQWILRKLQIPGRAVPKPPETAISESKRLGDCWAFPGDKGHLTIKLAVPIVVSSVSLEHMPGESDSDEISSAPKDFSVDGWSTNPLVESLNTPLRLIEGAEYNITSSTPAQNFQVEDGQQLNEHVQYVTLNVESNHGNSDCTCIYRFRVHGSQASGGRTNTSLNHSPSM